MADKFEGIRESLRKLDWKACKRQLDNLPADAKSFMGILRLVWHSDSFVRRRPGDNGVKRDRFLEQMSDYYSAVGVSEAADAISEIRAKLLIIDQGYVEIHSVVPALATAALTPEQRVSAAFVALDESVRLMLDDLKRNIRSSNIVMGYGRSLTGKNLEKYDPNAVASGLTAAAGDMVMLEAYSQGWFDEDNRIVLPDLVEVATESVDAIVANLRNANLWRLWKNFDERVRFLNGTLTLVSDGISSWKAKVLEEGGPKIPDEVCVAFDFLPEKRAETLDVLANERLDEILRQNFQKILRETNVLSKVAAAGEFVALPPNKYISAEEVHAFLMYAHLTKLDIFKLVSGDLTVAELLRGYAVLKYYVDVLEKEQDTYFPRVSYVRIHAELMRCGLSNLAADAFISRATFYRSSRDLYDQPLVKTTEGCYILFGSSLVGADLTKILMSNLANYGTTFEDKGKLFEAATISMLRRYGFKARNLKVWRGAKGEHEFDYDVAFTWGNYVFFLECKNRGLPSGNPIATYRFNEELDAHLVQVERLKQGLIDYPDILTKDFPEAVGKEPIFCLVNAMPFACGYLDGVYVVDDSILSRFFSSSSFNVTKGQLDGKGPQARTVLHRLWKGRKPTPDEFIAYLKLPPQLELARHSYELAPKIEYLSAKVCAKVTDYRRKDLSSNQVSRFWKSGLSNTKGGNVKSADKIRQKQRKKANKAARKGRANNRG
ncbi:hypothetical protein BV326_03508 [Pseudomonas syringae pv. actinidiae]|uniref:hypothetical protein n=1 Tax=Pseudomonas syringae TaxID=317 RepID=UPI000A22E0A1|nr:hypothetical protein [Pseudomonas syringae]OSR69223.1 hypothetical protein BV326_03508 [Pseudomonas syringae pv. actinidiae]